MTPTSWLEIDLLRLDANVSWWRQTLQAAHGAASPQLCAVVKANAYGLGAAMIGRRLASNGVDMLAVYSPDQAEELIEAGVDKPLLILMPVRDLADSASLTMAATTGNLHLSVDDAEQLASLDQFGRSLRQPLPVHLHVDTGMSRAGFNDEGLAAVLGGLEKLPGLPGVRLAGIYTHFATADSDTSNEQQAARFDAALSANKARIGKGVLIHAANTCAAVRNRRHHRQMVRVGLGIYGYSPCQFPDDVRVADVAALQPIVRWVSRVVHVKRYAKGTAVGYNATRTLERDSVLGIVPAGYADGYPLSLSNKSVVGLPELAGGRAIAPVLGRVNMDQIIIDLTDRLAAGVGAAVELVSNDPTSPCALPRLAELAGSSTYEALCRLSARLPRRYVGSEVPRTFFRARITRSRAHLSRETNLN